MNQTRRTDVGSYGPPVTDAAGFDLSRRSANAGQDPGEGVELEHSAAILRLGHSKIEAGNTAEAEDLYRQALQIAERALGPEDYRLVPALTSLARAQILRNPDDASPLVTRAIEITERHLGENNSDLLILLNDLTRLYLSQSAYALAEPLLVRLLDMKRSKGDDHPEVATVLASLAAVRQALGRHEAAEQLWRRVVEIRERVLAPNHFAIATALEHLASTCAARGKISEALGFSQRALSIRSLTLGAEHPSLRTARERIADLQLQASEGSLENDSAPDSWGSQWAQLPAPERLSIPASIPAREVNEQLRRVDPDTLRREAPLFLDREQPQQRAIEPMMVSAPLIPVAPLVAREATSDVSDPEIVPYRDVILAMKQEMEDAEDQPAAAVGRSALLAPLLGLFRSRQTVAVAAGVVVMLAVLLAAKSLASGASEETAPANESVASAPARSPTAAPLSGQPQASLIELNTTPAIVAANTSAKPLAPRPHVEERASAKSSDRKASDTKSIAIPNLPTGVMVRLDSVANAAGATVKAVTDFSVKSETPLPSRPRTSLVGQQSNPGIVPTHARPIGDIPTPSYPTQLAQWGVGGEVRSRFTVDATGHPVMSTFSVDGTPNPQLTEAVKRVIAGMRFEPAHAAGTGVPTSDLVVIAFQFAPPTR